MSAIDTYLDKSLSALGRGADEVADMAIDAYDYASELPDIIADGAIDAYDYIVDNPMDSAATAAEILPGAGVRDAAQYSAKATQNVKDKNYLDAAINTATSGAMLATEVVPVVGAMVAKPAIKYINKAITKSAPASIPKLLPETTEKLVKFLNSPRAKKLVKEGATKSSLVKVFNTALGGYPKKTLVTIDHVTEQLNISNPYAKIKIDADIPQPAGPKLVNKEVRDFYEEMKTIQEPSAQSPKKTTADEMYGDAEDAEYWKTMEEQQYGKDPWSIDEMDYNTFDNVDEYGNPIVETTTSGTGYPTPEEWEAAIVKPTGGKTKYSNTEMAIIKGSYDKAKYDFETSPRIPPEGPKVFVGEAGLTDDVMVGGKMQDYAENARTQAEFENRPADLGNVRRTDTGDINPKQHAELQTPMYSASADPLVSLWSFAMKAQPDTSVASIKRALKDDMYVLETYDGKTLRYDDLSDMSPDKYGAVIRRSLTESVFNKQPGPGKKVSRLNNNDQKKIVELLIKRHKLMLNGETPGTPEYSAAAQKYTDDAANTLRTIKNKVDESDWMEADERLSELLRTEVQYNPQKLPQHGIGHTESEIAFPHPSKLKWRKLSKGEQSSLYDGMIQSGKNFNAIENLDLTLLESGPELAYNVFRNAVKSQLGLVRVAKTPELRGTVQRLFERIDNKDIFPVLNKMKQQLIDKASSVHEKTNASRAAKNLKPLVFKMPQKAEQLEKYMLGMSIDKPGANSRRMFQGNTRKNQMDLTEKSAFDMVKESNIDNQMDTLGVHKKFSDKKTMKSIQDPSFPKFKGLHKVVDGMDEGGLITRKKWK